MNINLFLTMCIKKHLDEKTNCFERLDFSLHGHTRQIMSTGIPLLLVRPPNLEQCQFSQTWILIKPL